MTVDGKSFALAFHFPTWFFSNKSFLIHSVQIIFQTECLFINAGDIKSVTISSRRGNISIVISIVYFLHYWKIGFNIFCTRWISIGWIHTTTQKFFPFQKGSEAQASRERGRNPRHMSLFFGLKFFSPERKKKIRDRNLFFNNCAVNRWFYGRIYISHDILYTFFRLRKKENNWFHFFDRSSKTWDLAQFSN